MRNHPLYKKLKQIVLDGDYTIEQVENATVGQVAKLLGPDVRFSQVFFQNMKRGIIMALESRNEELNFQGVRDMASSFLDANFPGWKAERGKEGNKPYVTIWLKGKPNAVD